MSPSPVVPRPGPDPGQPQPGPPPEPLIAAAERWGWEYRDPRSTTPPFPDSPPAPGVSSPQWPATLATRLERARSRRGVNGRIAVALTAVSVGVAVPLGPLPAAAPALAVLGFGARAWLRPLWLRRRTHREYQRWLAGCIAGHAELQPQVAGWWQRRFAHERQTAAQADSAPQWFPLRPATVERADVCGGSPSGWRHLVAATAGSLLGTGAQVTVLDLTQESVTEPLRSATARAGLRAEVRTLTARTAAVNILSGLSAQDAAVVVAEAVHGAARETSHEARSVDATVLQQVCEALTGPITFARLHAALRVLMRQEPPPSGPDSLLSLEEYAGLDRLFGEAARRGAEERVFRLAAALQRLAPLGTDPAGRPLLQDEAAALRVVEVSEALPDLTVELVHQVLFQVMLHDLQQQEARPERAQVLVVAGADTLSRAHVERLDLLARRRGVRLVVMFRHLREDAVDLLGGGDAALFMRMGNAKEAEAAATFIGKEHRLVASQFTTSRSDSSSQSISDSTSQSSGTQESMSTGSQWSRSRGLDFGLFFQSPGRTGSTSHGGQSSTTTGTSTTWTDGQSTSSQSGTSTSESVGYQRTYDYTVTPKFLQELSPTAFVLVDPRDPGSPRLGDCDPAILDQPGVADHVPTETPKPAESAGPPDQAEPAEPAAIVNGSMVGDRSMGAPHPMTQVPPPAEPRR